MLAVATILLSLWDTALALRRVDLGGSDWTLTNSQGNVSLEAVTVPGDVHTSLLEAGIIDDPYYRTNELEYKWIPFSDWTYTKEFEVSSSIEAEKKVELVFEGLDTIADVYVNDVYLGRANNQFRTWVYDVKSNLNFHGSNILTLKFTSNANWAAQKESEYPYTVPMSGAPQSLPSRHFIRKVQSDYGWDWGPAYATMGIWKPLYIRSYSEAFVENIAINQVHNLDGSVDLNVTTFIRSAEPVAESLSVSVAGVSQHKKVRFSSSGLHPVSLMLHVTEFEYWWPNGYGSPTLYSLTASTSRSTVTKNIGFREVLLVEETYEDDSGKSFYFKVNGIPVFAKGANLIPFDSFPTRVTQGDYRMMLGNAIEANMNMVRVWGGGMYQPSAFYDIADEYGIMIWQEFIFACSMYPRDEAFLQNVEAEVYDNLQRLGHHASIVIFGGNNENEAAFGWFQETEQNPQLYTVDYAKLYFDTIYPALQSILPDRAWVHSSPSGGRISESPLVYRFGALGDQQYGDKHFYDYSNDCTDANHFPRARFVSEYGQQSWPSFSLMRQVTSPDDYGYDSEFSLYRQRHPNGQPELIAQMQKHFLLTPTILGSSAEGFDSWLYLTQVNQARCYSSAMSYWRRIKHEAPGKTMGILYWQLNDIWQGPSWSSVEYGGRWKVLHYHVKKTFADILVSAQEYPANNFSIYITSDRGEDVSGALTVQLINWDGEFVSSFNQRVSVPAYGSQAVYINSRSAFLGSQNAEDVFARLTFVTDNGETVTNEYYFAQFAQVILNDPHLDVKVVSTTSGDEFDTAEIVVTSQAVAPFVFLETDSEGFFSDNGFLALKEQSYTLTFTGYGKIDATTLTSTLRARSLFDTLKESA